jgi:hypothetical protein
MTRPGSGEPEVHRITAANKPHSDDMDARMNRYLVSMLIRTACFILMFATHGPLRWLFAVGAIFLPYIAVIFANAGGERREAGPGAVLPLGPRQLEARIIHPDDARIFLTGETAPSPSTPPDGDQPPGDAHPSGGTQTPDGAHPPDSTAPAEGSAPPPPTPQPVPDERHPPNG